MSSTLREPALLQVASVRREVRPLRFAFAIDGSRASYLEAVQLNTVLWGGAFNPIVPAPQLARYVEVFDPDFVVTDDGGPCGLALAENRLLRKDEFFDRGLPGFQDEPDVPGISTVNVYRSLPREANLSVPLPTSKNWELCSATMFGAFPTKLRSTELGVFQTRGATEVEASLENIALLEEGSPLAVSALGLRPAPGPPHILLFEQSSVVANLWLWNLRAFGLYVVPVPVAWSEGLRDRVEKLIERFHNHVPSFRVAARFCCVEGDADHLASFKDSLDLPKGVTLGEVELSKESAWLRAGLNVVGYEPFSDADETDAFVESGNKLRFRALAPRLRLASHGFRPRWANVIHHRLFGRWDLAEEFPSNTRSSERLLAPDASELEARISRSGPVAIVRRRDEIQSWTLPSGPEVAKAWFGSHGLRVSTSTAGKVADEVIRLVGGPRNIRTLAHRSLLLELQKANQRVSKCVHHSALLGTLKKLHKNRRASAQRHLDQLVEARVLELGVELVCQQCDRRVWLALQAIAANYECPRCLCQQDFPTTEPTRAKWAYRPVGPFGLKDHAMGAYVVASTVAFFRGFGPSPRTTWSSSLIVELIDENPVELDLVVLWRLHSHDESTAIFAECKTHGSFSDEDVHQMGRLASRFPDAVLVFATFADSLSNDEIARIRPLAERSRMPNGSRVMILTHRELTSHQRPAGCWADGSKEMQEIAAKLRYVSRIGVLCDATQQLYLGMQPSPNWPHHAHER